MSESAAIIQEMHDERLNASIVWYDRKGFCWYLGDNFAGFKDTGFAANFADAITDLAAAAVEHFPESQFAQKRKGENDGS